MKSDEFHEKVVILRIRGVLMGLSVGDFQCFSVFLVNFSVFRTRKEQGPCDGFVENTENS